MRRVVLSCLYASSLFCAEARVHLHAAAIPTPQNSSAPGGQYVASSTPSFGHIRGAVNSGGNNLPGVTVTATNTLTGKRYVTATLTDGSFTFDIAERGRYVVRAEFSAFAPATQEVLLTTENREGNAVVSMLLLSRSRQQEQERQKLSAAGVQGLQKLTLADSGLASGLASAADAVPNPNILPNAGLAVDGSDQSVAISGAMGRNDMPALDPSELQDKIAELRDQASRGGGALGDPQTVSLLGGGSGASGGLASSPMMMMMAGSLLGGGPRKVGSFNVNRPHGSLFYTFGGSLLDARPFSLNGVPERAADYNQSRFGIVIGAPLNIPHLYQGGLKTFLFASYVGARGSTPYDVFSTVPTQAERSGDFSGLGRPLIDPVTHAALPNNQIVNIDPAASGLLAFIPMPNLPGTTRNFHLVSSGTSTTDLVVVRLNHSFGSDPGALLGVLGIRSTGAEGAPEKKQQESHRKARKPRNSHWRQSVNGTIVFNRVDNDLLNPFPTLGGQVNVHNYNVTLGYNLSNVNLVNAMRFNYNRYHTNTLNHFSGVSNIAGQLGIEGVSESPADFGLPNLVFAPQFSSLQDVTPQERITQNFTVNDSISRTVGKHSWTWGGDYRRQLIDNSNAPNARGTFVFSGNASGAPFADFLLGFPQQTSVQFAEGSFHFSANAFDVFAQDNWRATKNLTLNLGLRYEYVSPLSELNGRLSNLDIAPGFTAVAPVFPGQAGPITAKNYPDGLIRPDRNNVAPRLGIAWKPFRRTVVRSGYSVDYNLGQYASMAFQLGFQPPFAFTQTNSSNANDPTALTLQNGFPSGAASITNSYAVDPDYRLGYVQTWDVNIQQELSGDMVLNVEYTGSKGTHLDIVRAPSLNNNGALLNSAQPFLLESSNGSSILHAGRARLRKRMRHGLSLGGSYTFSKAIDNASSIGGSAVVVAQNDLDLSAERGLSSFDQRHRLTADYYYQVPLGKQQRWLHSKAWQDRLLGGFGISGNVTVASGFPFSPRIFGSVTDLARGTNGSLRPDLVPGQSIEARNRGIQHWFNTAAFTFPAAAFGNAGRNIIEGPGTIDADMSLSKTMHVSEMQNVEFRITATNVFNHANFTGIDTALGSPTFGQVISVGSMRKILLAGRYRF
ncbi:MAG TPA: TonB-dependent receptor [Candidatus Angelobacter sp.]|jgi:outer membrane receptor protein involved in Fe transport|nr:TonB-dependent receptor [Candidatus Angelobacter sp.]